MAKVIIEIYKSSGLRGDYKVFDAAAIKIGRGYQNDLILFDPYISEEHAMIRLSDEGWVIEDLNSDNGTFIGGQRVGMNAQMLRSGDEIHLGRSRIRIVAPEHAVAPTIRMEPTNQLLSKLSRPLNTWGIILGMLGVFMFQEYLDSAEKLTFGKMAMGAMVVLLALIIWAGIWSFAGRVIKKRTQFAAQLSLSCLIFIFMLIFLPMSDYAGFAVSNYILAIAGYGIFFGLLFTLLLVGHLSIATHVSLKKQVIVASGISLSIILLVSLGIYTVKNEFNPMPGYYASLKPPFFKLAGSKPVENFINNSSRVFSFKK